MVIELGLVTLPLLDEEVHTVERHSAIVADDAPSSIGIGKPGDEVGVAALKYLGRISVEDAVIVSFAVLGEDLGGLRIRFDAVVLEARLHHTPAAEGHDRPLEPPDGLQAHAGLRLPV